MQEVDMGPSAAPRIGARGAAYLLAPFLLVWLASPGCSNGGDGGGAIGSGGKSSTGGSGGEHSGGTSGTNANGGSATSGGRIGSGGNGGSGSGGANGGNGGGSGGGTGTGASGGSIAGGTLGSGGAIVTGGTVGSGGRVGSGGTTGRGGSATGGDAGSGGRDGAVAGAVGTGGSAAGGTAGGGGRGGSVGSGGITGQGGGATGGVDGGRGGSGGGGGSSGGTDAGAGAFDPCPASGPCKIMPLGDSITEGTGYAGGYRGKLYSKATADGKTITFVGSLTTNPATGIAGFPTSHEGHFAWTIQQIDDIVPTPTLNPAPQIVLLHIGTNDVNQKLAGAPARLKSLVGQIVTALPASLVAVAKIIPVAGATSAVEAYNAEIPGIVQEQATGGKHVILVDQYTGFPTTELGDGVHPNQAGYTRMADVWYAAIKSYLH